MVKFLRKPRAGKQAGFSLLELLLVVGVGAVLILAGLSAYKLVSDNNAANQGVRQLQTLKSQVQQAFQGEPNYGSTGSTLVTILNNMRMLPPDMPLSGTNLRNGFGGTTTVTVDSSDNTLFNITFNNVSASACARMGVAYSSNNTADFAGVSINGSSSELQPDVPFVAAECDQATNTLSFSFR